VRDYVVDNRTGRKVTGSVDVVEVCGEETHVVALGGTTTQQGRQNPPMPTRLPPQLT
jgi:hypothetical protein